MSSQPNTQSKIKVFNWYYYNNSEDVNPIGAVVSKFVHWLEDLGSRLSKGVALSVCSLMQGSLENYEDCIGSPYFYMIIKMIIFPTRTWMRTVMRNTMVMRRSCTMLGPLLAGMNPGWTKSRPCTPPTSTSPMITMTTRRTTPLPPERLVERALCPRPCLCEDGRHWKCVWD